MAALALEIERLGLPLVATLPEDPGLFAAEVAGLSLLELPDDSPSVGGATPLLINFRHHLRRLSKSRDLAGA